MAYLQRRLEALEYPQATTFSITDIKQVHALVSWLEDTKIRFYTVEERPKLRKYNSQFPTNFKEYLTELGCTRTYNDKDLTPVIDWLTARAISYQYQDNADEYNRKAEEYQKKHKLDQVLEELNKNTDYNSEEFRQAVLSLARVLELPESEDTLLMLKASARMIERKFSAKALAEARRTAQTAKPSTAATSSSSQTDALLRELPLGFHSDDEEVDKAAKILRLLYISDLRDLQTKINQLIISIQNYTANPKSDTSLGRVGK
jgi:RLL motif-containing protein 1